MLTVPIPGFGALALEHLVLDFNGTLARDGALRNGVRERLARLAADLSIHVVTGDIHGRAAAELEGLTCTLTVLPSEEQAAAKRAYVDRLGAGRCAVIGNGRNDHLMLAAAALGVAVMEAEGAAPVTLAVADVATRDAIEALDLFLHPLRLVATLRG